MLRDEDSLFSYKAGDSKLWRFICSQKEVVDKGMKWQVKNGSVVSFFHDSWIGEGLKMSNFSMRPLLEEEEASVVADWVSGGCWDIEKLSSVINEEGLQRVATILPPRLDGDSDCVIWGASRDGEFSLRSAYFLIQPNPSHLRDRVFQEIWKWKGVERVHVFLWKALLDKLPTNVWRSSWSSTSALCGFCSAGCEDTLHILRDCWYARRMWTSLIKRRYVNSFFSCNFRDWLILNFNHYVGKNWGEY